MKRYPGNYEPTALHKFDNKPKVAKREPARSLSEFAREIGSTALTLAAMKGQDPTFPAKTLQAGGTGYYAHSALKAWWKKRVAI